MATCAVNSNTCSDKKIHLNDIGTIFIIYLCDCGEIVDLSDNISLEMIFRKPDTTSETKTAVLTSDGTDGALQYVTIVDDLDLIGSWNIQAKVELPTGAWRSDIGRFKVHTNLD